VSGVADLACNDDLIFAAANAHISAFTPAGKNVWQANSKGGSLFLAPTAASCVPASFPSRAR